LSHSRHGQLPNTLKDCGRNTNGDVVLAAIIYIDHWEGNEKFRDEDIKTIKRILGSIQFLDKKEK